MPRRELPRDPSIGQRIKARRELRRWSIRHAASRAGIHNSTWSRIERGELRTDRYMIADVAAALECSITDLTGQPYTPADRRLEAAHINAERVWRAMMAHPLTEPSRQPDRVSALKGESGLVRDLYSRCDYAGALGRLVNLVPALHAGARGRDDRLVLELMVPTYGVAMGSLLNLGHPAYAWLAVERCAEAAQRLEDAVALAVTAANRARVSAYSGAYRPARSVCDHADVRLQHALAAPAALDLLGFLHLARAHHAAGLHDPRTAEDHLAEAAHIARRTGETDSWDMAWGPRNVALWKMAYQLDTGHSGEAIETASHIRTAGLPAVRQVYFHLDMARGLADQRRNREAARQLLTAERVGPQHIRSSTAARETVRALLPRAPQDVMPDLRGLAQRMGVVD